MILLELHGNESRINAGSGFRRLGGAEFALIFPLLPAPKRRGCKPTYVREILNALFYLIRSGCPWRLPPRGLSSVHDAWRDSGLWTPIVCGREDLRVDRPSQTPRQRLRGDRRVRPRIPRVPARPTPRKALRSGKVSFESGSKEQRRTSEAPCPFRR